MLKMENISGMKILTGNKACAYGALLCRPDIISAYPITPQTSVLEQLYQFSAQGLLDAELIDVEGETSAIGSLIGASAAGARTFTSTSAAGLAFMYDGYLFAAGSRVPIVMAIINREQASPNIVAASQQDSLLVKDQGWIQIYVENNQEILDTIIMAYRLAEDAEILLPINVCYDGFYLSYMSQRVEVPRWETVDRFLAPLENMHREIWSIDDPKAFSTYIGRPELYTEYRYKHSAAMERAKLKLDHIDAEFEKFFGRKYGGQIEEYRTDDAEIVIVLMGSSAGTGKVVIDQKREEGLKVGLIKIRLFRPFPWQRLAEVLKNKKAIAVLDRNVCQPWGCGHVHFEMKAVLNNMRVHIPLVGFIDGLCGADIKKDHIDRLIEAARTASLGKDHKEVTWVALEEYPE